MAGDSYGRLTRSKGGRAVLKRLGAPIPPRLERYEPGQPVIRGPVLMGGLGPNGAIHDAVSKFLSELGSDVRTTVSEPDERIEQRYAALLFDATGATASGDLEALYEFLHRSIRSVAPSGRALVSADLRRRATNGRRPWPSARSRGSCARSPRSCAGAPPHNCCRSPRARRTASNRRCGFSFPPVRSTCQGKSCASRRRRRTASTSRAR
jgi:hypothetical protein